jgi:SAM-dependent methyltransferase
LLRFLKPRPAKPANLRIFPEIYRPEADVHALFWANVGVNKPRRVLEAGTLQAVTGRATHSHGHFPHLAAADYVRLDIQAGPDVDVVGDIHALPKDWTASFDCFIACAVWEHLERPWIAAKEVARVLTPGGCFFITTHQCFPIHGYPRDFFRFSRDALRLVFEDAGLIVDAADYRERAAITPPTNVVPAHHLEEWNRTFPSYILVEATGRKPT